MSSTSATTTGTGSVSISTNPAATGFPAGWSYQGCWVDGLAGRILLDQLPDNDTGNTLQLCVSACAAAGYTIAGAEYSVQCKPPPKLSKPY